MTMTPRQALQAYCDAFAAGDIAAIATLFAPDAVVELPLVGDRMVGHAEVMHEVESAVRGLKDIRVEIGHAVEGESDVIAEGAFWSELVGAGTKVDGTPERADFRFVAVLEMKDGRIARLSEYLDTKPVKPWERQRIIPTSVRRSPYWEGSIAAGAVEFMAYNRTTFPMIYSRTPYEDYVALTQRVTMWDVGCERQAQIKGPDALAFANYLVARDISNLAVGACRYSFVCDPEGRILCDPVILRPWEDTLWLSHGDVDLHLWARGLATNSGFDVEVCEPDVAPLQIQGPLCLDMLRPVVEGPIDDLKFYRCMVTKVAGIEAVVSRTGWSGALGFEIYPTSSARAMELWNALLEAGRPHGLVVTGPNVHRAVEKNVTDTAYFTNSDMNPFEAGGERLVDLDKGDFVGRNALLRIRKEGAKRQTVGLFIEGDLPRLEWFWQLTDASGREGTVRWAMHSYALDRSVGIALVDAAVKVGDVVSVHHPLATVKAEVTTLPFVED